MTLEADILFSLVANETDAVDFARDVRTTKVEYFKKLTDGTGADQAQIAVSVNGEVETFADFYPAQSGFVITGYDDRGTVTFTAIKAIYLKNTGTTTIQLLGGSDWPTGPLGFDESRLSIPPGGVVFLVSPSAAGWPTAGSFLGFTNNGATSGFIEIVLIGEGTIT